MSQKVKVMRVVVQGADPYLGQRADGDGVEREAFSADPDQVITWLCDGWRTRFNQLRSRRQKYGPGRVLIPAGNTVNTDTHAQSRQGCSWLVALPSLVLESTEKIENGEWWAAVKRRETLRKKGVKPGAMPGFKSRKHDPLTFACWFNGGRNAVLTRTGRKSGIVAITGRNPAGHRDGGVGFTIRLHVRLSQFIRPYTSVRVNWSSRTLVFVNEPIPVVRADTKATVGLDRGVTHQLATDDGRFYDLPDLDAMNTRAKFHQRRMAKSRITFTRTTGHPSRDYEPSNRYLRHRAEFARLRGQATRIITDYQHKVSAELVRDYDTIVTEKLCLSGMTRRAHGKGSARKRGLNRVMAGAALGRIQEMLSYKTTTAGTALVEVPAAYTSQRCYQCGHTASESRESQARFVCVKCGYASNADVNAARNIRWLHEHNNGAGLAPAWSERKTHVPGLPGTGRSQ